MLPSEVADVLADLRSAASAAAAVIESASQSTSERLRDAEDGRAAAERQISDLEQARVEQETKIRRLELKLDLKRVEIAELQANEECREKLRKEEVADTKKQPSPVKALKDAKSPAKLAIADEEMKKAKAPAKAKARSGSSASSSGASSAERGQSKGGQQRAPSNGRDGNAARRGASYNGRDGRARSGSSSGSARGRGRRERSRGSSVRSAHRGGGSRRRSRDSRRSSRGRSRSRHRSPRGGKGKGGKDRGKGDFRDNPLCIPYIMGSCRQGDRCRDRHPDAENCNMAKNSLQSKMCRWAGECRRKDCIFKHPDRGDQGDSAGGDPPWRDRS